MKPFVRFCHVCRVFLIIGSAGLFSLIAVTAVSLSHPAVAHAGGGGDCPNDYYQDSTGACRPTGFCPTGEYVVMRSDNHAACASSIFRFCSADTKGDPDSPDCIPNTQMCGSASYPSSDGSYCVVNSNYGYSPPSTSNVLFSSGNAVGVSTNGPNSGNAVGVSTNADDNCEGP